MEGGYDGRGITFWTLHLTGWLHKIYFHDKERLQSSLPHFHRVHFQRPELTV